jgi:hypothetical protein
MKLRLRWGFAFALTFIAGFAAGFFVSGLMADLQPKYPGRVFTGGFPHRPPSWDAASFSGPRLYWQGWVTGNMREIGEKGGMVYYVLLYIDAQSFVRSTRSDIDQYRDHELRCQVDRMANAEYFDRASAGRAEHLTGRGDLSPADWRVWWKANGATFVFTPEMLADYRKWLATRDQYQRWQDAAFDKLIQGERRKLGIK